MRTVSFLLVAFALLISACAPRDSLPDDSIPDPAHAQTQNASPSDPSTSLRASPEPGAASPALTPADKPNAYWVVNPSSGSRLYVTATYPPSWNGETIPALVLVPGGTGVSEPNKAARLAAEGFLVITFDPEGRGRSEGTEDYNGFIGQDGLAAVIEAATSLPGLDADRYGMVSFSYGVTMATGALARHPDLPIDFYIDWEGPVNRNYTSGCKPQPAQKIQWQPCDNEAWWAEREALTFIADVQVPYQRIQSQKDHVQAQNTHAIDIVNAAVEAGLPWVRLNEYPAGQTYDASNPPEMLSDALDRQLEQTVAAYARYIIENVLGR
ncbi:MAG: alpha/beta fold hydrolase [Chloroflexota bacterium]